MQRFSYRLDDATTSAPAVGILVLQSDETLESDLRHWLSSNVQLFHSRIANDQLIDLRSLCAMQAQISDSAALLPTHQRYQVIAYGCTSASAVIGEQGVSRLIRSVHPQARVTNPLTAIKANLAEIGAVRIGLITPYLPDVTQRLVDQLHASDIQVISCGTFAEPLDHNVARISQSSMQGAVQQIAAGQQLDAIVLSCTNLRTINLIEHTDSFCECALISSNSALAWHIKHLLNEPRKEDVLF